MNAKITVAVFSFLMAGITLVNLFSPSRLYSENENRYLAQLPKFTAASLANGKYTAGLDEYVTDQFAGRDGWVGLKTQTEKSLGQKSSGGVYFAADGYLIEMFDEVDSERYTRNLDYLRDFEQRVGQGLGVPVSTMLVPTASAVLAERLPAHTPEISQQALLDQADATLDRFVDVSNLLEDNREEYIYYKTDHHWTSLGAFYAYNAWREEKSLPGKTLADYRQEVLSDSFYGTTYSKASLYSASPDQITAFLPLGKESIHVSYNNGETTADSIYEPSYLEKKDKYSVFLNANQPLSVISTEVQNGERLLVVKDSYANTFVQMLLEDYEEIHVVDLRYYKASLYEYIEEQGITEALVLYNLKGFSSDNDIYFITR